MFVDVLVYVGEMFGLVCILQVFIYEQISVNCYGLVVEMVFIVVCQVIMVCVVLIGFVILVIGFLIVVVLWIGVSDVFVGWILGGEFSQFLFYLILVVGFFVVLLEVWGELFQVVGVVECLLEFLDIEFEISVLINFVLLLEILCGEIVFDDVLFVYWIGVGLLVVQNLLFKIVLGEIVVVVGLFGVGKIILFSLLMWYYDLILGSVYMNGVDVKQFDFVDLC